MTTRIIDEILLLPGVRNAYILDRSHFVLEQAGAQSLPPATVAALGERLDRMLNMSRSADLPATATELRYDHLVLVGVMLAGERTLLALCDGDVKGGLIGQTARLLAAESAKADPVQEVDETNDVIELTEIVDEQDGANFPHAQWPREVIETVGRIREALVHTVGPVGVILMEDYLTRWSSGGAQTMNRIPELLDLIAASLRDPNRTSTFRSLLAAR